jgi:hypothetical protein
MGRMPTFVSLHLCIFCEEFSCTRELVNMILDAIESVKAFNGIDGRL